VRLAPLAFLLSSCLAIAPAPPDAGAELDGAPAELDASSDAPNRPTPGRLPDGPPSQDAPSDFRAAPCPSCPTGQKCGLACSLAPSRVCVGAGPGGPGAPCSFENECQAGTGCFEGACRTYCDDGAPCPSGPCVLVACPGHPAGAGFCR